MIFYLKILSLIAIMFTGLYLQMFYTKKEPPKKIRYRVNEFFKIFVATYAALEIAAMFV